MHGTLLQYTTMSHLTILVWARAATRPSALHLPGLRRFFSTLMEPPEEPTQEGPPKGTPVDQVALTGQADRPEWILRWLEPP